MPHPPWDSRAEAGRLRPGSWRRRWPMLQLSGVRTHCTQVYARQAGYGTNAQSGHRKRERSQELAGRGQAHQCQKTSMTRSDAFGQREPAQQAFKLERSNSLVVKGSTSLGPRLSVAERIHVASGERLRKQLRASVDSNVSPFLWTATNTLNSSIASTSGQCPGTSTEAPATERGRNATSPMSRSALRGSQSTCATKTKHIGEEEEEEEPRVLAAAGDDPRHHSTFRI